MKRRIANLLATSVALIGGVLAIYFSYRMREPQGAFDWLSLAFAGLIVALIGFFLTWGHFQSDPSPDHAPSGSPVVTDRDQPAGHPPHRS